jgi:peptidyl-prolyl cis-trans isomerase D
VVSRASPQGLPPAALAAALAAPAGPSLAAWAGADLGPQGYLVMRVNRVLERQAPSPEQAAQERQQLAQLWAQAETQAYLQALRARYKTEIVKPASKE